MITVAAMYGMANAAFAEVCVKGSHLGLVVYDPSDPCAPYFVTRPALEAVGVLVIDLRRFDLIGATEDGRPLVTQRYFVELANGAGPLMAQLRQQSGAEFQRIAAEFMYGRTRDVCVVSATDTTNGIGAFHAAGGVVDYELVLRGSRSASSVGYSETLAAGRIDDCKDN